MIRPLLTRRPDWARGWLNRYMLIDCAIVGTLLAIGMVLGGWMTRGCG